MTDAPELLPCPFCGGDAQMQAQQGANSKPYAWHVIHHCKQGFIRFDSGKVKSTEAEVVVAWNTRADLAVKVRPLVWTEGWGSYCAVAGWCKYLISASDSLGKREVNFCDPSGAEYYVGYKSGDEGAKAAAQAHHDATVRAMLGEV